MPTYSVRYPGYVTFYVEAGSPEDARDAADRDCSRIDEEVVYGYHQHSCYVCVPYRNRDQAVIEIEEED